MFIRPGRAREGVPAANPLLDRLDPDDGRRLLTLECPIVWATTWADEANDVIAPLLALPALPVIPWPHTAPEPEHGLHWKTTFLTRCSDGRPFVWLDDEITDVDRRSVATHHPAPTLLHRTDPHRGLTADTVTAAQRWLRRGSTE